MSLAYDQRARGLRVLTDFKAQHDADFRAAGLSPATTAFMWRKFEVDYLAVWTRCTHRVAAYHLSVGYLGDPAYKFN
jgi:hypothetical protein